MKRFQDLQIGDIVGVLRLGGNNIMDFKVNYTPLNEGASWSESTI